MLLSSNAKKSLHRIGAKFAEQFPATSDHLMPASVLLRAGETRTVEVALANDEHDYTAMQCELVLPEGVSLKSVEGIDRGHEHKFYSIQHEVEENVYTLMGVSMSLNTFAGNEGNMLRITISADNTFDALNAELQLANVVLVTNKHITYLADDAKAPINDASGINEVIGHKEVASVRYVNVAGQESETPFDGVNIIVTTYTDGTTTTAKVIK